MRQTDHGRPEYPTGASGEGTYMSSAGDVDYVECAHCTCHVPEPNAIKGPPEAPWFCCEECGEEWSLSNREAQ